jgi:putative membrane protein
MKLGVILAFAAGLIAAVWLVWALGFAAVFDAMARAGFGGVALLCLYSLLVFVVLTAAWIAILPPGERRSPLHLYLARVVRDSVAEISPFSPVGGMVAAARLMTLKGMTWSYAAASMVADATTEAMAQAAFLAFGLAVGFTHFRALPSGGFLPELLGGALLLAVPGIALIIFLQRRGAAFAEKLAARFFPEAGQGLSLHAAIESLYDSRSRLAASAALHLLAWTVTGGGTWLGFRLVGGHITLAQGIALEAMLCTLRSIATFVPAGLGVQEGGYALLAPLFGLPPEMGVAVSLLKRAREIVVGVPALIYWQAMEGRAALRNAP